jgi:isocitrate dehydrogenase
MSELSATQGRKVNIGGYYHPPAERIISAMRPSSTFNAIIG